MSYRDVSESLRAYRARVAADLQAAREAARDAAERADRVRVLEKELAETDALIAKMPSQSQGRGRALPLLEDIAIAAPCKADWNEMVGDDRVRFCRQCEKNVYNLSALPREEAEALLTARESNMCVRLYKRADGTVLTSDCPVGVRRRRRRRAVAGVLGGGLLAAVAVSTAGTSSAMGSPALPGVERGNIAATDAGVTLVMGAAPVLPVPAPSASAVPTGATPISGSPLPRRPHGQGKTTTGGGETPRPVMGGIRAIR